MRELGLAFKDIPECCRAEPLMSVLGDTDGDLRRAAAEMLRELGEGRWAKIVRGDEDDLGRLGASGDRRAAIPLIRAHCYTGLWERRRVAAKAFAELARADPAALAEYHRPAKQTWPRDHTDCVLPPNHTDMEICREHWDSEVASHEDYGNRSLQVPFPG